MNYGLHLSASGALTNMHRMNVLANNLANVGTAGFKPDVASVRQRDVARVEDGLGLPSSVLLERLGGGVISGPTRVSLVQGPLETTGSPLDFAIEGDGFFVLEAERGADTGVRLTRDGRFTLDASGRLVSATSGLPVTDDSGRPIVLRDRSQVSVSADGEVREGDNVVARLRIVDVLDPSRLTKRGQSQFSAPADALRSIPPTGRVRQGMVEGSAVDPILAMLAVTEAGRAAEANLRMIQSQDRLMDRAINGLGRVN